MPQLQKGIKMGHVEVKIAQLKKAKAEVLALLSQPKTTADLLGELGADLMNFYMTKMIGDGAGHWDGSPHQLALQDLLDDGTAEWWRDEQLLVWYGLKGTKPSRTADDVVKEFFEMLKKHMVLIVEDEAIPVVISFDPLGKESPALHDQPSCLEVGKVSLDVENGKLEVYSEVGVHFRARLFDWPVTDDIDKVAATICKLGKWSCGDGSELLCAKEDDDE
jgi:hypothetical protein